MIIRLIIFFILNFLVLGLGNYFTGDGIISEWYQNLNKAPWTPPGWVFGASWTVIMVCFSFYMAYLYDKVQNKNLLIVLFVLQWILNLIWNPIFFTYHNILMALVVISSLTFLMAYFIWKYRPVMKAKSLLILPYVVWLIIATSLNLYALLNN